MTIQPIGGGGALFSVTLEDLRDWGTTPEELAPELALELVHSGAAQAGLILERPLEIEAYLDEEGLLLFARPLTPQRVWFLFPGLEEILEAARDLGPLCMEAELVWYSGLYGLPLPADARQALARLTEYTSPLREAPSPTVMLQGSGLTCMSGRALALLLDDSRERLE